MLDQSASHLRPQGLDGEHIAVVGAGLGGLTTALALLHTGRRVRVYEQAEDLGEVGAGISLSSGAGKALASLGLGPQLLAASMPIPDIAFVHYQTGELLAGVFDNGRPPDHGFDGSRHIHRADLHAILLHGVRSIDPEAVLTGKRITSAAQAGSSVTLGFADGTLAQAAILIGADGSRSAVRRLLFDDSLPEFAGQIAFRCLIPREAAAPYMGAGNAVVSIGDRRVFNRYLIRGGALVNVVGIAQSDRWRVEGWNSPATVDEFLLEFDGFHSDVLGLIQRAQADNLIKWGLFVRPPIVRWSVGRVALVGDAAHPILPFLGLGAALAIEDGVVLARALSAAPTVERAFNAFQNARVERVEAVRTQSIRQGEIIQASDPQQPTVSDSPSQNVSLFDYDPREAPMYV